MGGSLKHLFFLNKFLHGIELKDFTKTGKNNRKKNDNKRKYRSKSRLRAEMERWQRKLK